MTICPKGLCTNHGCLPPSARFVSLSVGSDRWSRAISQRKRLWRDASAIGSSEETCLEINRMKGAFHVRRNQTSRKDANSLSATLFLCQLYVPVDDFYFSTFHCGIFCLIVLLSVYCFFVFHTISVLVSVLVCV